MEAIYDMVEVRDGAGPDSTLLGEDLNFLLFLSLVVDVYHSLASSPAVLTGSNGPARDLYSTTNQMEVWLFTDSSGGERGFRANFTSGISLGSPGSGTGSCRNGVTYRTSHRRFLSFANSSVCKWRVPVLDGRLYPRRQAV